MEELVGAGWATAEMVGAHLAGVSPVLLLVGLAVHTIKLCARARAWQNVLRASLPERQVRYGDAAVPYLAGIGAGALVPFGGEVVRVALARTRLDGGPTGTPTAIIVGSLAVERALDAVISALVIGVALTLGLLPNGVLHRRLAGLAALPTSPIVAGILAGAIVLGAACAWLYRRQMVAAGGAALGGLRVFGQPRRYVVSVASWQLLAWVFRFGALVFLLEAFHVPSAMLVAPIVLSLQLLAGSVPVTPGGAGTQQALLAVAFGSGAMLAFSTGALAATTIVDVLLGLGALAVCGSSPLRVRHQTAIAGA